MIVFSDKTESEDPRRMLAGIEQLARDFSPASAGAEDRATDLLIEAGDAGLAVGAELEGGLDGEAREEEGDVGGAVDREVLVPAGEGLVEGGGGGGLGEGEVGEAAVELAEALVRGA